MHVPTNGIHWYLGLPLMLFIAARGIYLYKKNKTLIDNKYVKLEKMRRLLVVIVNESHLPKFLEVFNAKIGNDPKRESNS